MKERMIWFRHEPMRWLTSEVRAELNCEQRGMRRDVYDLCLVHGSIPADPGKLKRVLACTDEEFARSWTAVLTHLAVDPGDPSRLIDEAANELIRQSEDMRQRNAANGSRGGRPKVTTKPNESDSKPTALTLVKPNESDSKPTAKHNRQTDKQTDRDTENNGLDYESGNRNNDALVDAFNEFLDQYPNKIGTDEACRQWISLVGSEITAHTLPEIIAGLKRWLASEQWANENGKYIPAPAKWLREKKWLDQPRAKEEYKEPAPSSNGTNPYAVWVPSWKVEDAA